MKINDILVEMTTRGSIYDEIMNNLLNPRTDLKPELISELSISFLENGEKIEQIYNQGYFKYYFINCVKNQVHSNTSSFHKNIRIQDTEIFDNYLEMGDDTDLEDKIEVEEKLNQIQEIYNITKKSWFEDKMWEEYFVNNKTYRQIEKEYGLDHCLVFHNVKKIKQKIQKQL